MTRYICDICGKAILGNGRRKIQGIVMCQICYNKIQKRVYTREKVIPND